MTINGINYLLLERRGCEFEPSEAKSDIGNYRITTPCECIPGKDGKTYFLEFGINDRYNYRTTTKNGNRKLKKPVKELIMTNAATLNTMYTDKDGLSWRNSALEKDFYSQPMKYTENNILNYVNSISSEKYEAVKYIETFETEFSEERNPTPRQLMHEYAKQHKIEYYNNEYFEEIYKLYTGNYKYLMWELKPTTSGRIKVVIYLERI